MEYYHWDNEILTQIIFVILKHSSCSQASLLKNSSNSNNQMNSKYEIIFTQLWNALSLQNLSQPFTSSFELQNEFPITRYIFT